MSEFPFTAIVGADDMALALILTAVSPEVGGVLVRGEKGTAKSTMVRALAEVLPRQEVVPGCRFGCDPAAPDPRCPDGPHDGSRTTRQARLVELPVGAAEDRVIGSLDLRKALGAGEATFEPGLLALAHRGILYVDEVNLLHDHLVDVLLDAAAMGRNTVERDGVSVSHAARIVLIGTMNPEEGELRPQLLDRFGLTVEVAASREPAARVEVLRRRLAFDADPAGFLLTYAARQTGLTDQVVSARALLPSVVLSDWALVKIATVCAGFDVDGMRADIVTARAARAHAAWAGRSEVAREDIRAAARLALPHRRRRNPFDAPGLDEDLLDQLLGDDDPTPSPEDPSGADDPEDTFPDPSGPDDGPSDSADPSPASRAPDPAGDHGPAPTREPAAGPEGPADPSEVESFPHTGEDTVDAPNPSPAGAPTAVVAAARPFRARRLAVRGTGSGDPGRRSPAITTWGRTIGASTQGAGRVHLAATIAAAAPHQQARGRQDRLLLAAQDVRSAVMQGRETNLVLLAVDASGSMAARRRMEAVKTAVLSLLVDAYQRRDRVALVTFRAHGAELVLPPTSSVEIAARRLSELAHGGRTPLAEGLLRAAEVLRVERIRAPRCRPLCVVVTDGRATAGPDALARARHVADNWPRSTGVDAVVVDCESGRFRMGLARDLASRMAADYVPLEDLSVGGLLSVVHHQTRSPGSGRAVSIPSHHNPRRAA